jgi:hypothetical protein
MSQVELTKPKWNQQMTIKNQKEKPIKKLAVETINWRREVHQYHEPKPLSHLL